MDISRLIESRDSESPSRGNGSVASANSSNGGSRLYATEPSPYTPTSTYSSTPAPVTVGSQSYFLQAPSSAPIPRGSLLPSPSHSTESHHVQLQQRPLYPQPPSRASLGPGYVSQPHPHVSNPPTKRSAPNTPHPSEPAKKSSKWNDEETQLNVELRRTGMKWEDIAKRIPGRSSTSCRLRYQNYSEKKQEWNEEKKNTLARLYIR